MVDGFGGDGGPFEINVKGPTGKALCRKKNLFFRFSTFHLNFSNFIVPSPIADPKKSSTKFATYSTSKIHVVTQSKQSTVCTRWNNRRCGPNITTPIIVQDTTSDYFWSPIGWSPCSKPCGGGSQVSSKYFPFLMPISKSAFPSRSAFGDHCNYIYKMNCNHVHTACHDAMS